jgi:hypothetical protein
MSSMQNMKREMNMATHENNNADYQFVEVPPITDPVYPAREEPLSNDALNKIRADAQSKPQHHTQSARLAKQVAEQAAVRAATPRRITITVTEEQAERLKEEQQRSGAPVSLQVRRALDVAESVQKADENARA